MNTPRIAPLEPPYAPEIEATFNKIMRGRPPLNIFRTKALHSELFQTQMAMGGLLLYKGELDPLDRELVLHRTCARCGCEYEWGVHVSAFARPLGFSEEKIRATVTASWDDPIWSEKEAILVRFADEMHDTSTISEALWPHIREGWTDRQILELIAIAGNYHGISFLTNALHVGLEDTAERFPMEAPNPVDARP